MKTSLSIRALFLIALFLTAAVGCTMSGSGRNKEAAADRAAPAEKAAPAVDSESIAALEEMGGYLRSLKTFEVTSTTLTDEVMEDGIKLQFGGKTSLRVRRPDRLHAEVTSDRKHRQLFYDGKSLTLYGPRVKYYATVSAPPTLQETIDLMAKKYGVEMPLIDLFYWGTDKASVSDIKFAAYIGPATVDGVMTDQYVFRQEGIDWQVWIQQGKTPLPCKLVITTTSEPTQPEYIVTMRWNVAPKLDNTTFTFKPPTGALQIPLQTADGKVEAR